MIFHLPRFKNYLKHEKRYSNHTILAYAKDIDQCHSYLITTYGDYELTSIKHFHFRSWIVFLMQSEITEKSINRKISAIRTFFKFLKRSGEIEVNPTSRITAPKIPKRVSEFLHEEALQNLFESYDWGEVPFSALRDESILSLLYTAGLRRSELLQLKIQDVDLSVGMIKVLGKGNKERKIPIMASTKSVIEKYLLERNRQFGLEIPELFLTDKGKALYPKFVYNLVNEVLRKISTITKRSPHMLRHAFATHLSNNGAEINAIKDLLGHSSLAATQIYTQNSIQKLKNAHRFHPRSTETG